jgi:hypothetical protein
LSALKAAAETNAVKKIRSVLRMTLNVPRADRS